MTNAAAQWRRPFGDLLGKNSPVTDSVSQFHPNPEPPRPKLYQTLSKSQSLPNHIGATIPLLPACAPSQNRIPAIGPKTTFADLTD